jgi:CBS domain-containing protein
MKVKEVMSTNVLTVTPETPLKQVAALLAERSISGVPVCDAEGKIVGVISEADILHKEQGPGARRGGPFAWLVDQSRYADAVKAAARTAKDAMTTPPITIGPERPVSVAAKTMIERRVNRLPVVRGDQLVGIVTRADLVRAFQRSDEEIKTEIVEDVLRRALWVDPETLDVTVQNGEVTITGEVEAHSDARVLAKLVQRVPGVVSLDSQLSWGYDDLARKPPPQMAKRV